ncbi:cache domain-containing sensor histidine kinase [Cohnella fermenti]|uniref:HAMP domain-containing protein n=1 Tax=Cohnella fermenti TaxID=2565925 RepID=A0A4S4BGA6_9BACL|nr:histidine kinase [Cohnella fermenti]THF73441.1 HAMP domain-containing protein [Cohnella fermenti]
MSAVRTAETIKDEVGKTMLQLVEQNHVTMENTLSSVRDKTATFLDNHFFSNPAQFSFWTHIDSVSEQSEADTLLDRWSSDGTLYTLYLREGADTAIAAGLYRSRGIVFLDTNNVPSWGARALEEKGAGIVQTALSDSGQPTITFTRAILNPRNYGESIGFLSVSKLEVLLAKNLISVQLPEGATIFLLDEGGELLIKDGPDEWNAAALPGKLAGGYSGYAYEDRRQSGDLFAVSYDTVFHTRLVYQVPVQSIMGNQTAFQRTIMASLAIYLLLVLLFLLYLLRDIVKPLGRLVSFTRLYEPGKPFDLGRRPTRFRSDELGLLYDAFTRMTERLDQSIEENYGMQIKQKEQELSILHSQITPHLLYNTLDSIYWYAIGSGNRDVGEMVKDLSRLLRIGLSKGRTMITAAEELEHVGAYIRLQMKRYPETFEVSWDVGEGVEQCLVPKVIIQPLVENAIFHGIQSMDGEGMLWVRLAREGETLRVTVEDNGFIPVDLEKLRLIVRGELQDKGYGIRNVHQRIQLHFGEAYGLAYRIREGGGLSATIEMPVRTGE